jgi:hypothetical protein
MAFKGVLIAALAASSMAAAIVERQASTIEIEFYVSWGPRSLQRLGLPDRADSSPGCWWLQREQRPQWLSPG